METTFGTSAFSPVTTVTRGNDNYTCLRNILVSVVLAVPLGEQLTCVGLNLTLRYYF